MMRLQVQSKRKAWTEIHGSVSFTVIYFQISFFSQGLAMQFKLSLNSLCCSRWTQTYEDTPASASQVLGSQVCTNTPGSVHRIFDCSHIFYMMSDIWALMASFHMIRDHFCPNFQEIVLFKFPSDSLSLPLLGVSCSVWYFATSVPLCLSPLARCYGHHGLPPLS